MLDDFDRQAQQVESISTSIIQKTEESLKINYPINYDAD